MHNCFAYAILTQVDTHLSPIMYLQPIIELEPKPLRRMWPWTHRGLALLKALLEDLVVLLGVLMVPLVGMDLEVSARV